MHNRTKNIENDTINNFLYFSTNFITLNVCLNIAYFVEIEKLLLKKLIEIVQLDHK